MFQKECQFFCISAKAVQQFAHMITVTITCCQNDNRDIKNRVQQFSICSMPYTNKHLYMAYCMVCGGGVVCSSAAEGGVAPAKLARQLEAIQ